MSANILWVDDEIESLKSQVIFLENKGYTVETVSNGHDALEFLKTGAVDVVLLDESMPGISGLETLDFIRSTHANLPVVMVTKNEEENIMNDAIGSQITDYLIKPVHPNQVLSSIKKILDRKNLVSEKTTQNYMMDLRNLIMTLHSNPSYDEWIELFKKITYWELEIQKSGNAEMMEVFQTQKDEANNEFCKYIEKVYPQWIANPDEAPVMSHTMFEKFILPLLNEEECIFFVLIDNLRYDQWKSIEPVFLETFRKQEEKIFCSILPTATQYSRNSIFSGLLPRELSEKFPNEWKDDHEKGGKNLFEEKFLEFQLRKNNLEKVKYSYTKITNHKHGEELAQNVHNLLNNNLNVIVYNFVDMLSHARTEMEVLKELAGDEASYRSVTKSWFEHSPLHQALKRIAGKKIKVLVSTDHGTVRIKNAYKVIGDKESTNNLRYKHGRNLNFQAKDVVHYGAPETIGLPSPTLNSSFIFAKYDGYLCYPNNYNYYVNYFKNTFQHGGISLEEMLIPFVILESKA